jgi:hypothetical protein
MGRGANQQRGQACIRKIKSFSISCTENTGEIVINRAQCSLLTELDHMELQYQSVRCRQNAKSTQQDHSGVVQQQEKTTGAFAAAQFIAGSVLAVLVVSREGISEHN